MLLYIAIAVAVAVAVAVNQSLFVLLRERGILTEHYAFPKQNLLVPIRARNKPKNEERERGGWRRRFCQLQGWHLSYRVLPIFVIWFVKNFNKRRIGFWVFLKKNNKSPLCFSLRHFLNNTYTLIGFVVHTLKKGKKYKIK